MKRVALLIAMVVSLLALGIAPVHAKDLERSTVPSYIWASVECNQAFPYSTVDTGTNGTQWRANREYWLQQTIYLDGDEWKNIERTVRTNSRGAWSAPDEEHPTITTSDSLMKEAAG